MLLEKGYTDPDKFGEYLAEYLQTEEAKEIMNAWQQEIFWRYGDKYYF